jgi:hypothetical protein
MNRGESTFNQTFGLQQGEEENTVELSRNRIVPQKGEWPKFGSQSEMDCAPKRRVAEVWVTIIDGLCPEKEKGRSLGNNHRWIVTRKGERLKFG